MLTAKEALGILEGNGSLDISVEMSVIERKIKSAIKDEQYEVLIDLEEMTPVRRRKVLLTLGELGYRKYHTSGYRMNSAAPIGAAGMTGYATSLNWRRA